MLSSLLTERWVYLLFSLCQMPRLTKDTSPPEWKGLLTLPWIIEKRTMHAKFRSPGCAGAAASMATPPARACSYAYVVMFPQ